MASISSLTNSSSTSSIYGTRNVISGLASGLDTETLIQNAVSGYETKISSLTQKRTKLEWQQEAYRSIITKMAGFSNKFASYTSSTNLMSASFFNNAVKVSTLGAHKDKASATGKTSSDVKLLGVKQLATASGYTVSGGALTGGTGDKPGVEGGKLELDKKYDASKVAGTLTLGYGGATQITISIDGIKDGGTEVIKTGQELADEINAALKEQNITLSGNAYTADQKIKAEWDDAAKTIKFTDVGGGGNGAFVLSASGDLKTTLGIESKSVSDGVKEIKVEDKALYDDTKTYADKLKEEEVSFTLDGKTKKISLKDHTFTDTAGLQKALQAELNDAFGTGKVTAKVNGEGGLSFEVAKGSTLKVDNGKALGLESNSETSYVNTSQKLGDLLKGFDWTGTGTMIEAKGSVKEVAATKNTAAYYKDADGNRVAKNEDGKYYRVDEDGNWLHKLEINGETVGAFSKNTAFETVMTGINGNADANVTLSYSKTTNQFKFTARDSGTAGRVDISGGLAGALFGDTYTTNDAGEKVYGSGYVQGKDAMVRVSVNGEEMELERSSNTFDIDGLSINVKDTFGYATKVEVANGVYKAVGEPAGNNTPVVEGEAYFNNKRYNLDYKYVNDAGEYVNEDGVTYTELLKELKDMGFDFGGVPTTGKAVYQDANGNEFTPAANGDLFLKGTEAVTFKSEADADTIVDAIKSMVEEYNAMVKEVKDAYSTLPLQKSNGAYYEPLTSADEEGMSESAIKSYEEKAKTGLLFADRDLSNLYTRLTNAVQSVGLELSSIGISTTYDDGLTTLSLNESKLRSALETDPDKVRDVFTKSKETGASSNGLMTALKSPLDMYAATTGATKGILVEKAGSSLAPTSVYQNTIQKQLDELDKQIESWQDKLSDKVDYYTSKFTQLEQLINEMNSQSSALAGLTGGY